MIKTLKEEKLPSASIIVPAKNEATHIGECLKSLLQLDYPDHKLDITVVDNGSTDSTSEIALSFGVNVVSKPSGFVGAVKNTGVSTTSGQILAFIDADCEAPINWLAEGAKWLFDPKIGAVGGMCFANPKGNWIERAWAAKIYRKASDTRTLPGSTMIFRREVFNLVGGFNEKISAGEDDEICKKCIDSGYRVVSEPLCDVVHLGYPDNLFSVARRQIWHGANQLDVASDFKEPQLVLTHLFLFGVLLGGLTFNSLSAIGCFMSLLLLTTPILTLAYSKSFSRKTPVINFLQMLPIGLFFYTGRSIGLIRNYLKILRSKLKNI